MDGFLLSLYAAAGGFTTSNRLSPGRRSQDFDPCSLCGERRTRGGKGIIKDTFQFTLSLRRATVLLSSPPVMWQRFQSTLSLRRATVGGCRYFCIIKNFNPRSPHGERRCGPTVARCREGFQSTLSLQRATTSVTSRPTSLAYFNPRSPCGERQQIPPNWPYRFCLKCQFKDGEKSKKAKGSASAQASSPAYEKNKVRIPWGDFECFRFAPIK